MRRRLLPGLLVLAAALAGCAATPGDGPRVDLKRASQLNAELGRQYMVQGRLAVARRKLEKALQQDDDNGLAHHFMAELHRRTGKLDEAEVHFRRALELLPKDPSLLNNYGVFLCDRKEYDRAMTYFRRVLDDPFYAGKAQAAENLGLCARAKGDVATAERYLGEALRLDPKRPKALIALAGIRFDQGQAADAYDLYRRFLRVGRHTPESLWLGWLLETERGNHKTARSYAVLLKGKFPDSEEAARLRRAERSARP